MKQSHFTTPRLMRDTQFSGSFEASGTEAKAVLIIVGMVIGFIIGVMI